MFVFLNLHFWAVTRRRANQLEIFFLPEIIFTLSVLIFFRGQINFFSLLAHVSYHTENRHFYIIFSLSAYNQKIFFSLQFIFCIFKSCIKYFFFCCCFPRKLKTFSSTSEIFYFIRKNFFWPRESETQQHIILSKIQFFN